MARETISDRPGGEGFAKDVRSAAIRFRALKDGGGEFAERRGNDARHGGDARDLRRGAKRSVAAEEFVAAETGERDFQTGLARGPGDEDRC